MIKTERRSLVTYLEDHSVELNEWQKFHFREFEMHVVGYDKFARNRSPWRWHHIVPEGSEIPWTHGVAYFDGLNRITHSYPLFVHLLVRYLRIARYWVRHLGWRHTGICPTCREPYYRKEWDNWLTRLFWRCVGFVEDRLLFPIKAWWRRVTR